VHHILSNGGDEDTLICDYMTAKSKWASVTSTDLMKFIRLATTTLCLQDTGIDPDLICMALKLHGYSDTTIKKFGRWSSLTFLGYIHNQIAHLSNGVAASMSIPLVAASMSIPLPFVNIAVVERRQP